MTLKVENFGKFKSKRRSKRQTLLSNFKIRSKKDILKLILSILLPTGVVVILLIILIPIVTYLIFARDLSTKESIMNRNNTGVTLYDRNGKAFFSFYQAKQKSIVALSQIPSNLQKAVIAVEDKDFYSHPGFSLKSILAALWADIVHFDLRYGGSTITQQLVKNALLTQDKNFLRKYQEVVLAAEIERRFTKDEILEMYLNSVYFGEGSYGVSQAAQTYFGKNVISLNLAESALLGALPVAPSGLSPISGSKEKALERFRFVLEKMEVQKYITPEQKETALKTNLVFKPKTEELSSHAAHFALMVKDSLINQFGEETVSRSGFKVYTGLDLDWQIYAESQVAIQVKNLAGQKVSNAAAVVIDPRSGEIRTLVGSYRWDDDKLGKVNMATTPRQPGSSFKPIVYIAGFESRLISPATVLHDDPISYDLGGGQIYKPLDYDLKFRGDVLVRRALANSLNIPAVELLKKLNIPSAVEMGKRLGLSDLGNPSQYGLSLVLGAAEVKLTDLTNVYATFANGGTKFDQVLITKIDDKNNKRVFTNSYNHNQVLNDGETFLISSILSDNSARAEEFGNLLTIFRPAAVKTGTTSDYKDSWTLGYTPSLAVGVWVGNNDNTPMNKIAGSLGAAPIWRNLMTKFLNGTKAENFTPPGNVVQMAICRENGLRLVDNVATISALPEYFIRGTEPTKDCLVPTPTPVVATDSAFPIDILPSPYVENQ